MNRPTVELRDAFRGGWGWVVLIVPIATALAAAYLFVDAHTESWESTAEFSIREHTPDDVGTDVRVAISSFEAALGSRRVADEISTVAGVDAAVTFVEVLSSREGGELEVTLTAPSALAAEEALELGVRQGLTMLAEGQLRRTERQIGAADDAVDDFIETLLAIENAAGAASLADEIARRSGDILALRNQIASAEGDPQVRDALTLILAEKQAELAMIEDQLLPWTSTKTRLDLAVDSAARAELRLRELSRSIDEIATVPILTSVQTTRASMVLDLLRTVVAAALGAGVVVVGFALLAGPSRRWSGDAAGTARPATQPIAPPPRE